MDKRDDRTTRIKFFASLAMSALFVSALGYLTYKQAEVNRLAPPHRAEYNPDGIGIRGLQPDQGHHTPSAHWTDDDRYYMTTEEIREI